MLIPSIAPCWLHIQFEIEARDPLAARPILCGQIH
uniref:Uncharacterized protein n=1 Tax=Triticum urartu TaxID=4572 RepID=A0A8R7QL70_TRIUA